MVHCVLTTAIKQRPAKNRRSCLSLLTINRVNNEGDRESIKRMDSEQDMLSRSLFTHLIDKKSTSHWLLITAFLLIAGWIQAQAQPVHIPDENLRAGIQEYLELDTPIITQADMLRLVGLPLVGRGIADLTGLEYATNLQRAWLFANAIENLEPLANLTRLELLALAHNRIRDVSPLANLHNLESLGIEGNRIIDHSPLDDLTLSHFTYDQSCELPPEPLEPRLNNRSFPSIVAAFLGSIHNRPDLESISDYWDRRIAFDAEHDLFFSSPDMFSQRFMEIEGEWHLRGSTPEALDRRRRYFARNANMIFIAEVRIRDWGGFDAFPDDHPYWLRKPNGEIVSVSQGRLINYAHPVVQDIIVGQVLAVSRCGLYDGIFFDWWDDHQSSVGDYIPNVIAQQARDNIIQRIREGTRPNFLIMGNTNNRIIPRTGPHINGGFMETLIPGEQDDGVEVQLDIVREALHWLETNLREPRINSLEGLATPIEPPNGPTNRRWMRAFTALSLTHSDGYVLFASHGNHTHYWYDFWDADLGQPMGPKFQFYEEIEGLYIREFTNGWAVYNQSGEAQVVTLPEEVQSAASGLVNTEHAVLHIDGDIYLRTASKEPADVNGDGMINILDLVLVAQGLGTDDLTADVNGDGVVNVFDLVFVANQFN